MIISKKKINYRAILLSLMRKVVFVPGYMGKLKDAKIIKKNLNNFELIYFDYDTQLREPLEYTAEKLKRLIESFKLKNKEKISLIGVSAGGVIIDYYLKFLDSKKVDKFISLHSPFKGTYLASFPKNRKGIEQLKKKTMRF
jgi:triacylglycerol esterase/lipase EstA (alpha/beta hydrolase family)